MASNGSPDSHISTFIVDDHPSIRDAIRSRIDEVMDIDVSGEAGSSEEALRQIEELGPTVTVIDLSLEDGHGLDLIENLNARCPDVRAVVFSMYEEEVYAERALRAGAAGYVMKTKSPSALVEAIRRASEGNVYLSERMTSRILSKVAGGEGPNFPIDELTDRELSVVQMLGQGYSVEEITDRLNLARKTIETYRRRAKEKLGFETVSDLLQFALMWTYRQSGQEKGETDEPPVPASE
ncbi:MAG: response regulator transcription factor [Salinibacter sp.]